MTSELNRQLQALQSDKDCLILENRRLLKKIEVLEEIKTALRAQEGKAAAKAAMSIELEHSLRDMKMRLEVSEQKLANAKKMKIGVDVLRAQLAKVELDSLELKDKISSLENLKDDMKSKLDSQESLLKEMCGLMVGLWKKEHPDENPPSEPLALRDWIKGRMSSADEAKAAAETAKKKHEASMQALEVKLDEIQAALEEKEVALQKAAVTMNLDKARIEQLELELKNMYAAYSVVNEDVSALDTQRKNLLMEKEERDRMIADQFHSEEQKKQENLRRKKEAAEKADAEMARKIQQELEEERKKETASRRRFMMEASGFEQCEDENSYWKTKDPKSGRSYYVNCKTMETTWDLPEGARVVPRNDGKAKVISNSTSSGESPRKALMNLERRLLRFYSVYKADMASQVHDIAQRYVRSFS